MDGVNTDMRREQMKRWFRAREIEEWKRWSAGRRMYAKIKSKWGREAYVSWGSKQGVALKMTFRTEAANLDRLSDTCAMCGKETREDETHVLLECNSYEGARKKLIRGAARIWGARKYKQWQTLEDIDRAAALLGPDSNRMTKSRKAGRRRGSRRKQEKILDKLMKDFLITVEAQRRERGLESMTGNKPNKTEAARA
jgi:hypothetical protein